MNFLQTFFTDVSEVHIYFVNTNYTAFNPLYKFNVLHLIICETYIIIKQTKFPTI